MRVSIAWMRMASGSKFRKVFQIKLSPWSSVTIDFTLLRNNAGYFISHLKRSYKVYRLKQFAGEVSWGTPKQIPRFFFSPKTARIAHFLTQERSPNRVLSFLIVDPVITCTHKGTVGVGLPNPYKRVMWIPIARCKHIFGFYYNSNSLQTR